MGGIHDDVLRWPWSYLQLFLLQDFLCQIERYCRQCHLTTPITFPPEHPVEEVGRLLLCCLLKHEDLGMRLDVSVLWRPLTDTRYILSPCSSLRVFSRSRGIVSGSRRDTGY